MSIRFDKKTGKAYTWHNIPLRGKKGALTAIDSEKGHFVIQAKNYAHPEESWYNGEFIGDEYAVFRWTGTFFQQVTPWYARFGYAVRMMSKLAKKMTVIEKIMCAEDCSKADAEKFYQLAKELESPDYTKEKGVEIYKALEELRRK